MISRRVQLAALLALGTPALARAESWSVVSVNHCSDVAAGEPARTLREALTHELPGEVLKEEATAKGLGGSATGSLEQAERLFGAARLDFTGGGLDRARRELAEARDQIVAVPPSADRWHDYRDIKTMEAWLQLRDGAKKEAEETLRGLLAVEPDYVPSEQIFPPMVANLAASVRKELRKEKRHALQVRTVPAGLPVYVGLKPFGQSPQKVNVPAGTYRIEADFNGPRGIPRSVEVGGATDITLASALEGSVWPDRGPCVTTPTDRRERLKLLTQMASLLNAQKLVGIEFDEPARGERYLVADVLDAITGQEIRAARVKLDPEMSQATAINQLASFVVTGKATNSVQVVASEPAKTPPPQPSTPPLAMATKREATPAAPATPPPAPAVAAANPVPPHEEATRESGTSGMRIGSYAAFGVAAVGAGFGVFELTRRSAANSDFDAAYAKAHAGDVAAQQQATDALNRASTAGTLATVGFVAAGAAAATGVVLFVLSSSDAQAAPTATVIDGRPAVAVAGRF